MKNFIKYLTASCLGTILALALIVLVLMAVGLSSTPQTTISSGSTLHIQLEPGIPELTGNVPASSLSFPPEVADNLGLNDITKAIINASKDNKISSMLIETEFSYLGQSTTLSIYNAIESFKNSGKPVLAYGNYFSQSGYMLASLADTVVLNPNGQIDIRGFGMLIPHFAKLLENIDANVDVYFAGQFKSAIEPYYRREISPQNEFQSREFLLDWQDQWLKNATKHRKSEKEDLLRFIDGGEIAIAEKALESGLVDKLMYRKDFDKNLKEITGRKPKLIDLVDYAKNLPSDQTSSDNRIAIVYLEGEILNRDVKGIISADRYKKIFDRVQKNEKVKAVVLRVNSPGGDAVESDIIWDHVEELKAKGKYVVASFGDYAASGGYYISCGADKIVTQPNTLTGSIGVFAMIPDLSETFSGKLGIDFDTVGTGKNTFIYSPLLQRTPAQNTRIQHDIERTYAQFLDRVGKGRKMTTEEVDKVAQGRVWSGEDAVGVGLADQIGDLKEAIELAANAAEIDDFKLLQYPVIKKTVYEELLFEIMNAETIHTMFNKSERPDYSKSLKRLLSLVSDEEIGRPQYRLPFFILEE